MFIKFKNGTEVGIGVISMILLWFTVDSITGAIKAFSKK